MTKPTERVIETSKGTFRLLEWPGPEPAAVFLHGLSGVADVWGQTINALGKRRVRCIAIDQRGHGQSPQGDIDYRIGAFVADLESVANALGLEHVHLVGHSMGARVAMVAGARTPDRYRSVSIVDIGPEQWRQNWVSTVDAFSRMPHSFASEEEALSFASRSRPLSAEGRAVFLARLRLTAQGLVWRADIEALKTIVRVQRSRNYWAEWERLGTNALLVRGGTSTELRPQIAEQMRRRNPSVVFREVPGAPHNLPLAAPEALAQLLDRHWRSQRPDPR